MHSATAMFPLTSSAPASLLSSFWVVKAAGAAYLQRLGFKAIRSRSLVSFVPAEHQSLARVFTIGLLSRA